MYGKTSPSSEPTLSGSRTAGLASESSPQQVPGNVERKWGVSLECSEWRGRVPAAPPTGLLMALGVACVSRQTPPCLAMGRPSLPSTVPSRKLPV